MAGAHALTLTATQGDIYLDTVGADLTGFTASCAGSAYLDGNITVASTELI